MMESVIAIGSNAIRMLTARRNADASLACVRRERRATRPFAGLTDKGFTEQSMRETVTAVTELKHICDTLGAHTVSLFATSATRDAANSAELAEKIRLACGLTLQVISGDQEAAYSFLGASGRGYAMVMDIGGGSTECVRGCAPRIDQAVSLQLGAVRLHHACPIRCEADAHNALQAAARLFERDAQALRSTPMPPRLVGVGGTLTALGAHQLGSHDPTDPHIQGLHVSTTEIEAFLTQLYELPPDARHTLAGVSEQRADILPNGLCILLAGMRFFRYSEVETSIRGNMDGFLMHT